MGKLLDHRKWDSSSYGRANDQNLSSAITKPSHVCRGVSLPNDTPPVSRLGSLASQSLPRPRNIKPHSDDIFGYTVKLAGLCHAHAPPDDVESSFYRN